MPEYESITPRADQASILLRGRMAMGESMEMAMQAVLEQFADGREKALLHRSVVDEYFFQMGDANYSRIATALHWERDVEGPLHLIVERVK